MLAMLLNRPGTELQLTQIETPTPSDDQVLIKVQACGICRTDLHIIDGELPAQKLPLVPGHQIIGKIVSMGSKVKTFKVGDTVGVSWLGSTCGNCEFCVNKQENLCDHAQFTGYHLDGGLAEYCVANAAYCFNMPTNYTIAQAAPLLCAGLIGYRAYQKIHNSNKIGLYGFGSAAHILAQFAKFQNKQIYAFTRTGDLTTQKFALQLGACWAGSSEQAPPELLDAAIIFAPVGALIPQALAATKKGGIVVCAGIHMSEIPAFSYDLLWAERILCSVANLTRQDGREFLDLSKQCHVNTEVTTYKLADANQALQDLRQGNFNGSAVVVM